MPWIRRLWWTILALVVCLGVFSGKVMAQTCSGGGMATYFSWGCYGDILHGWTCEDLTHDEYDSCFVDGATGICERIWEHYYNQCADGALGTDGCVMDGPALGNSTTTDGCYWGWPPAATNTPIPGVTTTTNTPIPTQPCGCPDCSTACPGVPIYDTCTGEICTYGCAYCPPDPCDGRFRVMTYVFDDTDEDGVWDGNEEGINLNAGDPRVAGARFNWSSSATCSGSNGSVAENEEVFSSFIGSDGYADCEHETSRSFVKDGTKVLCTQCNLRGGSALGIPALIDSRTFANDGSYCRLINSAWCSNNTASCIDQQQFPGNFSNAISTTPYYQTGDVDYNFVGNYWNLAIPFGYPGHTFTFDVTLPEASAYRVTTAQNISDWFNGDVGGLVERNIYAFGIAAKISIPTADGVTISNDENDFAPKDAGRSHICQNVFRVDSSNPRRVFFWTFVSDADGKDDISKVDLRFSQGVTTYMTASATGLENGGVGSWTLSAPGNTDASYNPAWSTPVFLDVSGVSTQGILVFGIDFESDFIANQFRLYDLDVNVYDEGGASSGWTDANVDFKVWDCQVDVSGSLYDASAEGIRLCPSTGYTNSVASELGFSTLVYQNAGGNKTMTVTSPTYSDGGQSLTWGEIYTANFGVGVSGSDPSGYARVSSTVDGVVTSACPGASVTLGSALVGPYESNPTMVVDFSTIADQDPWFQTSNMSIQSKSSLTRNTPVTCVSDLGGCTPATTFDDGYEGNGFCVSPSMSSDSGCAQADGCYWGRDDDWYRNYNPSFITNNYGDMYRDLYENVGEGVVNIVDSRTDWGQIMAGVGWTGLIFFDGDLTVNADNILSDGQFLLVVVNGNITINQDINLIAGAFLAEGDFVASGESDDQLVISGVVYASGNISLIRGFATTEFNNTEPAVSVVYRPDIIFNAPSYMFVTTSRI